MILIFHFNDINFTFFFQNFCILNITPILFYVNNEVILIGMLNIFITFIKFSADYDTYSQFPYLFDFFGIEPIDNYN